MRKHLTAALIFVVLTLILTNPMLLHLWNSVEDKQDGLLNTWIVAWVGHALITDPLNLYNTNIFYPYTNTLAFSEILLPPGLVALPFTLATNNPIFGYNLSLLSMLWLDAFAMYLFVSDLTRRTDAAWIAGAIYAFNPFNLGNFAQMQLLTLGFLPLALLFLAKTLKHAGLAGSRATMPVVRASQVSFAKFPFLFALFFILQALSSFYYALLAGIAVGLYLLWWLITQRADLLNAIRRVLVPLAASFALIALVLIPFLLPYFQVSKELGFTRTVQESEPFSASLKQFIEVSPQNVLYGQFLAPNPIKRVGGYPLDNLFPGLIAVLLALVGIFTARIQTKFFLLLLLLVSFTLALGPRLFLTSQQATNITLPYRWLYDLFPPVRALRAPVRFDALINFALAALAGLGAAGLFARISARPSAASKISILALGVVALIALEYLALPAANTATLPVANEIPDVYKWLAQQPPGVVLELPMMGPNAQNELDISTQYYTTYHWQKTPDGYSGFIPPRRGEVAYEMQSFPSIRSVGLARALDINYVIDSTPVEQCYVFAGPIGYVSPIALSQFKQPCIYEIPQGTQDTSNLTARLYVPSIVAAGAPFQAYLVLVNSDVNAFAVKPTDRAQFQIKWDDGRTEQVTVPIPLVTFPVSVIPIPLTAPSHQGSGQFALNSVGNLLGSINLKTQVAVTNELATEVVIPASVELAQPLNSAYARGETLQAALHWLPLNKINAYYSASLRLVNANGDKVANADRQPAEETFLWKPNDVIPDTFQLPIPSDISAGNYRVELIMYQANTDTSALLLDQNFTPQQSILLGEIQVK